MEGWEEGSAGEGSVAVRGRLLAGMDWAHYPVARPDRNQMGPIAPAFLPSSVRGPVGWRHSRQGGDSRMKTAQGTPHRILAILFLAQLLPACSPNVPAERFTGHGRIDRANGLAYFKTNRSRVLVVSLGQGSGPPTLIEFLPLDEGEPLRLLVDAENPGMRSRAAGFLRTGEQLTAVVSHEGTGDIYFYSYSPEPGWIVKIAGASPGEETTRVGEVALDPGPGYLRMGGAAVIDTAAGYAYFGTARGPGIPPDVVKVALGEGSEPPRIVGSIALEPEEANILSAVIDPERGFAYFGAGPYDAPNRVVKVALGEGAAPPRRAGAVILEPNERGLAFAFMDADGRHAFFGTDSRPSHLVKVALGDGSGPPRRVGGLTLDTGRIGLAGRVASVIFALFGGSSGV